MSLSPLQLDLDQDNAINWDSPLSQGQMWGVVPDTIYGPGGGTTWYGFNRNLPVDGSLANGATWSQVTQLQRQTLFTAGTNAREQVNFGNTAHFGSGDFTVGFWINKLSASSGFSNTWGLARWNTGGSPGTNEYTLSLTNGGTDDKPTFNIEIGTTIYGVASTVALTIGVWCFVVGLRRGTTLEIYLNGNLNNTAACGSGAIINRGRNLKLADSDIGLVLNTKAYWLDPFVIQRALSATEVNYLYQEALAGYPNLLNWRRRPVYAKSAATSSVSNILIFDLEFLEKIQLSDAMAIESIATANQGLVFPIETLESQNRVQVYDLEDLENLQKSNTFDLETLTTVNNLPLSDTGDIEDLDTISRSSLFPVETLLAVASSRVFDLETLDAIKTTGIMPLEVIGTLKPTSQFPVETILTLQPTSKTFSLESNITVAYAIAFNAEHLQSICAKETFCLETFVVYANIYATDWPFRFSETDFNQFSESEFTQSSPTDLNLKA